MPPPVRGSLCLARPSAWAHAHSRKDTYKSARARMAGAYGHQAYSQQRHAHTGTLPVITRYTCARARIAGVVWSSVGTQGMCVCVCVCVCVSPPGVKALTAAHSRLISLDISGCPLISATGVSYLGALTRLTSLHMTHMGLAAPPITDDCLVSLCDLKELSHFALGCIKVRVTGGACHTMP